LQAAIFSFRNKTKLKIYFSSFKTNINVIMNELTIANQESVLIDQLPIKISTNNVSNADILLAELDDAIGKHDNQMVDKLLSLIPLENLTVKTTDSLLISLSKSAQNSNNTSVLKVIFDQWNRVYPNEETVPFYIYLYIVSTIPLSLLQFYSSYFKQYRYMDVIFGLIELLPDSETLRGCVRADQVYGPQKATVYRSLYNQSKFNQVVRDFLIDHLRQSSDYIEIPSWVHNYTDIKPLPTENQVTIPPIITQVNIPNLTDLQRVKIMTEGLNLLGLTEDEITTNEKTLLEQLSTMTLEQKNDFVTPYYLIKTRERSQSYLNLFRLLGPVHPLVNATVDELVYGGERMFTSSIFDYDEETDITEYWFKGFCENCHYRIRRPYHAVRIPMALGGWKGCFCSWNCAREFQLNANGNDVLVETFIDKFEQEINEKGIQDRLPNANNFNNANNANNFNNANNANNFNNTNNSNDSNNTNNSNDSNNANNANDSNNTNNSSNSNNTNNTNNFNNANNL
jgi:hypothetical protein